MDDGDVGDDVNDDGDNVVNVDGDNDDDDTFRGRVDISDVVCPFKRWI